MVARRNSESSGNTFQGAIGTTIRVATIDYEQRRQECLEIDGLGEDALNSLRKIDPFMYYSIPGSIPGTRRSSLSSRRSSMSSENKEDTSQPSRQLSTPQSAEGIDDSNQDALSRRMSRRHSAPAEFSRPIRRRTSISFEAHPDLIMEDVLNDPDLSLLDDGTGLESLTSLIQGLDDLLSNNDEQEEEEDLS